VERDTTNDVQRAGVGGKSLARFRSSAAPGRTEAPASGRTGAFGWLPQFLEHCGGVQISGVEFDCIFTAFYCQVLVATLSVGLA